MRIRAHSAKVSTSNQNMQRVSHRMDETFETCRSNFSHHSSSRFIHDNLNILFRSCVCCPLYFPFLAFLPGRPPAKNIDCLSLKNERRMRVLISSHISSINLASNPPTESHDSISNKVYFASWKFIGCWNERWSHMSCLILN